MTYVKKVLTPTTLKIIIVSLLFAVSYILTIYFSFFAPGAFTGSYLFGFDLLDIVSWVVGGGFALGNMIGYPYLVQVMYLYIVVSILMHWVKNRR
ncbi:MAG: hypothetical protein WAV50_00665 [Minisyncoccia bacterium]